MNNNNFETTVASLFKGMDSFITTKTVVGDAVHIGDTIILPLVDVSFGVGAGASSSDSKNNGAGGLGGKISPSAVLVIKEGDIRLVNVKNQDAAGTGNVSGMLLYARTEEAVAPDCSFVMGGNRIGVKTLDLNKDFSLIAAQLDGIAEEYFGLVFCLRM